MTKLTAFRIWMLALQVSTYVIGVRSHIFNTYLLST